MDWRTPVIAAVGLLSGGLMAQGFLADARQLGLMTVEVAALVLLFATDLDQRLLPDGVTVPLIGLALAAYALGIGPFVHDTTELMFAAIAALAIPAVLYLVSIPFGPGAIGQGDLKLLVSVGLLGGLGRLFLGLVAGAIAAAVVIVVLVALRRITLRTYVPYGPFLIAGALWALLGGAA
jgi:leader peptidase (prepilin peptidase)/N-methyltransferase